MIENNCTVRSTNSAAVNGATASNSRVKIELNRIERRQKQRVVLFRIPRERPQIRQHECASGVGVADFEDKFSPTTSFPALFVERTVSYFQWVYNLLFS